MINFGRTLCYAMFYLMFLSATSVCFGATGIIEVYSEPNGAKVYVDAKYVGKTPYQNARIPTGSHKIEVSLSSEYPTQRWDVTVDSITPQIKTFYFKKGQGGRFTGREMEQTAEKHKGNIQFASIPTGASIYINGELQKKKTPTGFTDADVGRYNIEFKINKKSLKGEFDIVKDETVKLIADFNNKKIINAWEEEKNEQAIEDENKRRADIREKNKRLFWPFEDNEDGTVTKLKTMGRDGGTIYNRDESDSGPMTWDEAVNYCRNLIAYGYNDWRLPSLSEQEARIGSGFEEEKSRWDSLNLVFPNLKNDYYWSATSNETQAKICHTSKYYNSKTASKNEKHYVNCVRGRKSGGWMNPGNICNDRSSCREWFGWITRPE